MKEGAKEGEGQREGIRRNTVTWNKSDLNGLTHSFSTFLLLAVSWASFPSRPVSLAECLYTPHEYRWVGSGGVKGGKDRNNTNMAHLRNYSVQMSGGQEE